jgi:DNA gyrase subunit A
MIMKRPDLDGVPPEVIEYIEKLEREIEQHKLASAGRSRRLSRETEEDESITIGEISEPTEPPTTRNVITITAAGIAKRTPRHHYNLQRRSGMGIFDIETEEDDPPASLVIAEPEETLLLVTSFGRAFRLPVDSIPETTIRSRGVSVVGKFNLETDEKVAVALPIQAEGYLALLGESGMVRMLRHHVFGEYMKPGTNLFDLRSFGKLADACWTPGDADLLIATCQGKAIRFPEKLVSPQGSLGIRLSGTDQAVAIASVYEDSGVFLLGEDGKGTIRLMSGFSANKSPGAGGKIAFMTDRLVGAMAVDDNDQIFIISQLSKIIRFRAEEIPPKEGVVQGVVCISLRGDEPATLVRNPPS